MEQQTQVNEEHAVGTIRDLLEGFHISPEDVTSEAEFEALGLDSLDLVELSVKVEDVYGIDIEEDDLEDVRTVGDAARIVVAKVTAKA